MPLSNNSDSESMDFTIHARPNGIPRPERHPSRRSNSTANLKQRLHDPPALPSSPTGSQLGLTPQLLTLVLVARAEHETDRYALVPFPRTYEDAQKAAIKALGKYLTDRSLDTLSLRISHKNKEGEWIWAEIGPDDWETIVLSNPNVELGVFETNWFLEGHLWLTVGYMEDGKMVWSKVRKAIDTRTNKPVTPWINRAKSYRDALTLFGRVSNENADVREHLFKAKETSRSTMDVFKVDFFIFPLEDEVGTRTWRKIPPAAEHDETLWKQLVPLPGRIFGVALSNS